MYPSLGIPLLQNLFNVAEFGCILLGRAWELYRSALIGKSKDWALEEIDAILYWWRRLRTYTNYGTIVLPARIQEDIFNFPNDATV